MRKLLSSASISIAALILLLTNVLAQQTQAAPTQQGAATESSSTLTTQKDKVSYALGMNLGANLKRQSVEVDPKIFLQGMQDAMAGEKTQLTEDQAKATLVEFQTDLRKKMQEKMQQAAETNKKQGDEFLAANKSKEGVVVLPSGLQYKVLSAGAGPKPTTSDSVVCNYRGTLIDGTEFDSSYKRKEPATFPVTGVIKGWTEALQLMPVGSKWQLFVPSDLGYGAQGAPGGAIGPNATLIFEVELLSIQPKDKPKAEDKDSKRKM